MAAESSHISVLLHEALDGLSLRQGAVVLDATLGGGGHSSAICAALCGDVRIVALDADSVALERARAAVETAGCPNAVFRQRNFRELDAVLEELGIESIDAALFDLGMSSDQLDASVGTVPRGFSFQRDEPLLMTLSDRIGEDMLTARTIVNEWPAEHIETILRSYGDEQYTRRIARALEAAREESPIETSAELARIVEEAVPAWYRRRRIHPATKTFQALRIAVNDEWEALQEGLRKAFTALAPGGRLAVISFHSMEDRAVKRFMREQADAGTARLVNKKPIAPSREEIVENPRARSAKLRVLEKA